MTAIKEKLEIFESVHKQFIVHTDTAFESSERKKWEVTDEMRDFKIKEFHNYYPEYSNKKIIPIFASLYLPDPDNVTKYLIKNGIYAMATRDDMMDIMNFTEVVSKT